MRRFINFIRSLWGGCKRGWHKEVCLLETNRTLYLECKECGHRRIHQKPREGYSPVDWAFLDGADPNRERKLTPPKQSGARSGTKK